jgi:hypothetical protein
MSLHRSSWILLTLATLAGCAATPSAFDATSTSSELASMELAARADDAAPSTSIPSDTTTSSPHGGPLASHDAWEPWSPYSPIASAPAPASPLAPRIDPERYGGMQGDWEFTIGGTGNNDKNFDVGGFSATGSVGLFLTNALEISVRDNASFASPSIFNGSTRVALDINFFPGDAFRPVLGANIGYVYGDSVHDTWSGAPEGGFKIYLQKRAFIEALAEYQFFFNKDSSIDSAFDDGQWVYTLVLGLNF